MITSSGIQEIKEALRDAFPEHGHLLVMPSSVEVGEQTYAATVIIRQDSPADAIPLEQRNAAAHFYGNAPEYVRALLARVHELESALKEIAAEPPRYVEGQSTTAYSANLADYLMARRQIAIDALAKPEASE